MRVRYSTLHPNQSQLDSLPWLPLVLQYGSRRLQATGLVDSGATINVLPYDVGLQVGATWDDQQATIQLAGNLGRYTAMPLVLMAGVGTYTPARLAFAWSQSRQTPLILGQTNFFFEFEIHFYRAEGEFEIDPRM